MSFGACKILHLDKAAVCSTTKQTGYPVSSVSPVLKDLEVLAKLGASS
jgi:hypothetical protein